MFGLKGNYKHKMSKTKINYKWQSMKRRCYNKNCKDYKNYGGRGIKVCDEWLDFIPFMQWSIENGYSDDLELDRIDNGGNYEPGNCRYVEKKENNRNKRNNHYLEINGKVKTISEWSEESGVSSKTIQSRIKYGWENENLILPTKIGNNQYTNYKEE
jgi:hypothetical protein